MERLSTMKAASRSKAEDFLRIIVPPCIFEAKTAETALETAQQSVNVLRQAIADEKAAERKKAEEAKPSDSAKE